MVACGYVSQRARGRYGPGPRIRQIGRVNRYLAPETTERILAGRERFSAAEGEACVLTTLVSGERLVIAKSEGTHAVRVWEGAIESAPFFAKATGRMLAALADEAELDGIIERQGWPGAAWDGIRGRPCRSNAVLPS
jgi:DNA-binding IclR family transcriptional regulator